MAGFIQRWTSRLYHHVPIFKEIKFVPESFRASQELFLQNLLNQPKYQDPKHLARFEHQLYSQNGEDGALQEIFNRIGTLHKTFVEIGVGNGMINNTVYFLALGWKGWWCDGDSNGAQRLRKTFHKQLANSSLRFLEMFITRENIAESLAKAGAPLDVDLLSIDIDRNTWWIWKALEKMRPRVILIEYNASFPPSVDWVINYDANAMWDGSNFFGASLRAYVRLGNELGYKLVGCDLTGTNCYFVREDLCGDHFRNPYDAQTHFEPPRYWLSRTLGHPPSEALFSNM